MKRGEIWTFSGGQDYAGKPRPAAIIQDDSFDATSSVTICAFTTRLTDTPFFRPVVVPSHRNGLKAPSQLIVDKITTVPKSKTGSQVGRLSEDDLVRLNRAVLVFLGLAGTSRSDASSQDS